MPRDVAGNYTLPAGNPVVTGTLIDIDWANPTMSDIALQLNNVVTRDGLLGPTSPIKFPDGTNGAPAVAFASETNTGIYKVSAGLLGFSVLGSQRMSIDNAGRVGIGVSGAAYPLDIRAAEPYVSLRKPGFNTNFYGYNIMASTDILSSWLLNATSGETRFSAGFTGWGGYYTWFTDGTERMTLTSTGALRLNGSTDAGILALTNSGHGAFMATSAGDSSFSTMRLRRSGGTGVGAVAQFEALLVTVGSITITGAATTYNTSSDYRLKHVYGDLRGSGEFIDAMRPRYGMWKADGSPFVGFVAHELQEVSPASVTGVKDGEEMQQVAYASAEIIANVVAELQDLRIRVAALEL